jgi:hypothetical protein
MKKLAHPKRLNVLFSRRGGTDRPSRARQKLMPTTNNTFYTNADILNAQISAGRSKSSSKITFSTVD